AYELAPFAFALVLTPQLEQAFRQSLIMSGGNPMILVQRPITAVLLLVTMMLIAALIIGFRPRTVGSELSA
ncbi:tripartite tricarboxylate transporter permease, partial [Bradyrhizobium sp. LHD-71]|nr:tripartite tricarboxylate transporter permease [Bradyrhizobium sp. LHD-71]